MTADYPFVGIRRATVADAERLSDLLRGAFAEYEQLYTRAGYAATTPSADRTRERLAEGPTWARRERRCRGHRVGAQQA